MADVKAFKVTSMPTTWVVNALYFVKIGAQVNCYVTDSTGTPYLLYGQTETDPVYTASIPSQLMNKADIPNSANLNTYTITGIYHQNINTQAVSGTNYPAPYAGKLEVVAAQGGLFVYQKYHVYQGFEAQFFRSYYNGTWSAWSQFATKADAFPNVVGGADMNTIPRHQVTYIYPNSANTPVAGNNYMAISIGIGSGEYPAAQMAFDVYPLANDVDGFYYRKNYDNGFDSRSPWYQVASRSWSNANLIQNQNTSAQTANGWITGTFAAGKFIDAASGYTICTPAGQSYTGFFTDSGLNTAATIKAGALVISSSYADTASTNGLSVKGQSWLIGGAYTNAVYPYSGTSLTIGASGNTITIPTLSSGGTKMVVATSTGQLSTQELPSNLTLDSAEFTPTIIAGTATSYSPKGFRYIRVGNVVHVVGHFKISGIPTAGANTLRMSLPVGTTIGDVEDVAGTVTGFGVIASSATTNGNKVEGYVNATPQCSVSFMTFGTSADLYVTFSYAIH